MDKLLPAIDWVKKNRFWIGCAVLSIAMIGTWFWITTEISGQTSKNASDVKSQIQAADGIMRVSAEEGAGAHPNTFTEEGMKKAVERSLQEIVKAWEMRYQAQQTIMKWPIDIIGDKRFVPAFSQFEPAEKFPEKYQGGLGLEQYLQLYRITIPKQMAKLCRELGTNWIYDPDRMTTDYSQGSQGNRSGSDQGDDEGDDEGDSGGRFGGIGGGIGGRGGISGGTGSATFTADQDLNKYPVIWNETNQAMWYRKLTDFQGKDNHVLAVPDPTPLQVYMLQQDLWLLEAMFSVIKSVNGTADANDLAVIKEMDHIAFGREARTQLGVLTPFDPRLAGNNELTVEADTSESVFDSDDSGDEASDDEEINGFNMLSYSPYHGRYVNLNFEPIHAEVVREVLTTETDLPLENLELIVAKRIPFRIALKMDERKIPEFLAACANSPFSFEINQIRLNRHIPNEGIVFNGGGHGEDNQQDAAGGSARGGNDTMGSLDMGGSLGRDDRGDSTIVIQATEVETRTNYDVRVEFYGIVKIYNPVREKLLRRVAGQDGEPDPKDSASNTPPTGAASKP